MASGKKYKGLLERAEKLEKSSEGDFKKLVGNIKNFKDDVDSFKVAYGAFCSSLARDDRYKNTCQKFMQ